MVRGSGPTGSSPCGSDAVRLHIAEAPPTARLRRLAEALDVVENELRADLRTNLGSIQSKLIRVLSRQHTEIP